MNLHVCECIDVCVCSPQATQHKANCDEVLIKMDMCMDTAAASGTRPAW